MQLSILGIDLGKNSCSLVGFDASGAVVLRRRMRRDTVVHFCAKLETSNNHLFERLTVKIGPLRAIWSTSFPILRPGSAQPDRLRSPFHHATAYFALSQTKRRML